jgi:signal transduction histidine kinase
MIRSLRFRLGLGAVIAIAAVLLLVWFTLSRLFTDYVADQYRTEMAVLSDSLTASAVMRDGRLTLTAAPSDPRLNLPGGGRYWELEADDVVLERSRSLWDTVIEEKTLVPSAYAGFLLSVGPDGAPLLVMRQDSTLESGGKAYAFCIFTAFPLAELEEALTGFHRELLKMLLLTAGLLALGAFLQASMGLSPLDRLRRKVAEIRAGNVSELGDEGPSEVQPLVREIDLLLKERETAIERARSRASDLAHGLKTPLTVIAQLAASMEPDAAEMTLKQVDIIRQRADRQLQAARLGVERMVSADVGELTAKLVQVLKPVTEERRLQWQLEIGRDLIVAADPADLAEAIGNVLDNASKWARSRVRVNVSRHGDAVRVLIEDDGPGVPAAARAEVLARGVRSLAPEGGSGLGLAIVADIAQAYNATLTLADAVIGGLAVVLELPAKERRDPSFLPH